MAGEAVSRSQRYDLITHASVLEVRRPKQTIVMRIPGDKKHRPGAHGAPLAPIIPTPTRYPSPIRYAQFEKAHQAGYFHDSWLISDQSALGFGTARVVLYCTDYQPSRTFVLFEFDGVLHCSYEVSVIKTGLPRSMWVEDVRVVENDLTERWRGALVNADPDAYPTDEEGHLVREPSLYHFEFYASDLKGVYEGILGAPSGLMLIARSVKIVDLGPEFCDTKPRFVPPSQWPGERKRRQSRKKKR